MRKLILACALTVGALFASPTLAQSATFQTNAVGNVRAGGTVMLSCDANNKNCAPEHGPATSTPLVVSPPTGDSIAGPMVPQPGRDLRIIIKNYTGGTINVGTSSATEACTVFNQLTVGGQSWANFIGNANEVIDTPQIATSVYCLQFLGITGTPTVRLEQ